MVDLRVGLMEAQESKPQSGGVPDNGTGGRSPAGNFDHSYVMPKRGLDYK